MREFVKPIVVISKCIEFENVRWDGQMISSDFVKKLTPYVKFVPICPEVEIGLGVPRYPIRIILLNGGLRLIQPETNLDITEKMQSFAYSFLDSLQQVDGFILKSRSPTSAFRDAKIYPSIEKKIAPISKAPGFFAAAILERFRHLAIEDEGRLRNQRIREHFLTKLFTLAGFREAKTSNSLKSFIRFHSESKLLLKTYNQKETRILGRIVANQQNKSFDEMVVDYEKHLFKTLKRAPRCGSTINVMMNALGYFSDKLSKKEKTFFLDLLEKYRAGKLPVSVNAGILKSWIIRFKEEYLMNQSFFEPYPEELMDIDAMTVYCDGKDYWKQ